MFAGLDAAHVKHCSNKSTYHDLYNLNYFQGVSKSIWRLKKNWSKYGQNPSKNGKVRLAVNDLADRGPKVRILI